MSINNDVAFLVYEPLKEKRKENTFDGNDNIGALVVADILYRGGVDVGYCSVESANKFRVVLVSLTSTYDVYSLYSKIHNHPHWQPGERSFKVVVGGFGMQNPYPIRMFADYAIFGRAEGVIGDMVGSLLGRGDFSHPSVMRLPDITPVTVNQVGSCYPHSIPFGDGKVFTESFIGCKNKCRFCHYTWIRDCVGDDGEYQNMTLAGSASKEITWKGLIKSTGKYGRVRSALDGLSQRLRYLYGKHISNYDIIEGIERLGAYGGNTVCILYNVANMPTETDEDLAEFSQVVSTAKPASRVIIVLHSTPFRPSLGTPMQWEPVSLSPNWNSLGAKPIFDSEKLRVVHSTGNEAPWSHLMSVVAERADETSDNLFHTIATSPKLKKGVSSAKVRAVGKNFNLNRYLRRYEIGEESSPGWWLGSMDDKHKLEHVARVMRGRANIEPYT